MKRYTVLNLCMRQGSYRIPQSNHALSAITKKFINGEMTEEARGLFSSWLNGEDVEVVLQGGGHNDLENLFSLVASNPNLPSAKFNESVEAMNGACMSVTFVASPAIVAAGDYIRKNRLTPYNAVNKLSEAVHLSATHSTGLVLPLSNVDIEIAAAVAFLSLA